MLVTDKFVLLHVHRTGGTWVEHVIRDCAPEWNPRRAENGKHDRWRNLPEELAHLPKLTIVRNPWDWYVSWYHWFTNVELGPDSPMWDQHFKLGRASFAEAVTNACSVSLANRFGRLMWERKTDLYSAWFWNLAGEGVWRGDVVTARFEALREQLVTFLSLHVDDVPDRLIEGIGSAPRVGESNRKPDYRDYYDDELRDLVGSKNELVQRYEYAFG